MEKTDPHLTHHYSNEQLIKYAYTHEIFHVKTDPKYDNVREILVKFMKDRMDEITERWK